MSRVEMNGDVYKRQALQGAVPPVLDVNVGFLVQLADGGGRDLAAPQMCIRDRVMGLQGAPKRRMENRCYINRRVYQSLHRFYETAFYLSLIHI